MLTKLTIFSELDINYIQKLNLYSKLLTEWNEKINLISRKDIQSIIPRHIVPCLAFNRVLKLAPHSRVIDVGTGGGFPGIPLAITNPYVQFTLVDSIQKKIRVLEDIVQKLNLTNVELKCERVENLTLKCDFVVGRAVANLHSFLTSTRHLLRPGCTSNLPNGVLYLKGHDVLQEIQDLKLKGVQTFSVNTILYDEDYSDKFLVYVPFNEKVPK